MESLLTKTIILIFLNQTFINIRNIFSYLDYDKT